MADNDSSGHVAAYNKIKYGSMLLQIGNTKQPSCAVQPQQSLMK